MSGIYWFYEIYQRLRPDKVKIIILSIITIVGAVIGALPSIAIGSIIDSIKEGSGQTLLIKFSILLLLSLLLQEIFIIYRQYLASIITLNLCKLLRIDMLTKITKTKINYFQKNTRGDIIQNFTDDLNEIQKFGLELLPKFIYEIILATIAIVVIACIFWPLAIIGLMVYLLYLIPLKRFGIKQRKVSAELRNHKAIMRQQTLEKLESLKLIKILGNEEKEKSNFFNIQKKWSVLVKSRYVTDHMFRNFPRVLDALAPALVFLIGGWKVFSNQLTIGELVIITGYLPAINAPIRSFSTTFLAIKDIDSRLVRVVNCLKLDSEESSSITDDRLQIIGGIKFSGVSLKSDRGYIVKNVSFCINPGEHIAIVGSTGSGKSSILRLITKLYKPSQGKIYIDNNDLCKISNISLKKAIGIVTQDTFLFNESLKNNLSYIKKQPINKIEEILFELKLERMLEGSEGINKLIGNNGLALSGGQRQRLGVARAILGEPQILLLDEATSALDIENEKNVMNIINNKFKNKTIIFVAHRLETVIDADKILVFKKGELIEQGTHQELRKKNGEYTNLWNSREGEGVTDGFR
ncbi:ABC transporter ATP-binding protein [Lysinibacillus sp. NPDC097231]|uniref:ABC transporter ATP-binding protein n=1 Tax=Lysinibacillus sp. NPDC097231 TaxID=3364142 RepID=UPI0037FEDDFC